MTTEMADALIRKREKQILHLSNMEYVARFYERLRYIRGSRSQLLIACMADVTQSCISRVESGSASGIGYATLQRILDVYKEIEAC